MTNPETERAVQIVLAMIGKEGGALFSQILECLADAGFSVEGAGHVHDSKYPNLIYWANVSEFFVEVFNELLPKLEVRRADPKSTVFFSDRYGFPMLPVVSAKDWAEEKFDFTEPHWVPLVFFLAKESQS